MDNFQIQEQGLNLDEWDWEQIQSPSTSLINTQQPTRNPSREWDMAAIRDNYLLDSLSFFPPSQHDEGGLPAATPQDHEVPNSPPSSSSSSSSSKFENLSCGIARRFAARVRHCAVYIGGFCSFAPVTGVLAAVLLSLVYARWRRRVQEENHRLILLIKEKDQKIRQLLLQIAQMNELLSARRKIGGLDNDYAFGSKQLENGNGGSESDVQQSSASFVSPTGVVATMMEENTNQSSTGKESVAYDLHIMTEPYGVPCMVEIVVTIITIISR